MIRYRPEIDGLRAIAIISVVCFHAFGSSFPGGYIGVDIFFVISGYLITSIVAKEIGEGHFSFRVFYIRRARRILPALLAMTLVTTVAAFIFFLPEDLIEYGKILIYTLLFGANFRLAATPGYFDHSMQENPLLHMWSLSVEEQFYFLWPAVLILALRFLPRQRLRLATFALAAASLLTAEVLVHLWPRCAFFHLPARGWELLGGAALALNFIPKTVSKAVAGALSILALVLMIAPVFLYTKDTVFPGFAALPPVLGCALFIHANDGARTPIGSILASKPFVFIGLISYSLYIWHWPVFALASYLLLQPLTFTQSVACIAIASVIAVLSWRFIERPFRKSSGAPASSIAWARWPVGGALRPSGYAALAALALLVASGSFFQESKGAPWRLPADIRHFTEKANPWDWSVLCAAGNYNRKGLHECQFGSRSPRLILWGDSHAQHYLPLIEAAFHDGVAFMQAGCMPLADAVLVTNTGKPLAPRCAENNRYVLDQISRRRPSVVVLASRWTQTEKLPYGREKRPNSYLAADSGEPTRESSRRTFATALKQTVNKLTNAGINVILMGQVPEMIVDPNYCLALSKFAGLADCRFVTRGQTEDRQSYVNKALAAASEANPNVFVFDPIPTLCGSGFCEPFRNSKPLYFDGDHLNVNGALTLLRPFSDSLPARFTLQPEAKAWPVSDVTAALTP